MPNKAVVVVDGKVVVLVVVDGMIVLVAAQVKIVVVLPRGATLNARASDDQNINISVQISLELIIFLDLLGLT